jgi:hypothetical protein
MKIDFNDLKIVRKLLQEDSSAFLGAQKEPNFLERNKSILGIGAAGVLGAAGAGYLGHVMGADYGASEHGDVIADMENAKNLQQSNIENIQASQNALQHFDPKNGLTIDEHLLRNDGVSKIMADIEREKDKALENIKLKYGVNSTEGAEATSKILDNYNANKTALQDALHSNTKFLGDFRSGGEVQDLTGSNKVPDSSFFSRMFANDDLTDPTEANIQNRARIDALVKKANAVSNLNDNIDTNDVVKYNNTQIPVIKEKLGNDLQSANNNLQSTENELTRLNTPESKQQFVNKYSNIGTGIGALGGGAGAAITASKLANAAKEHSDNKAKENENNLNSYGEQIKQDNQRPSLIGIR